MLIPGTIEWMLESLDLRTQYAARTALRRLERAADARLAVLTVLDGGTTHLLEYAGDLSVLPTPQPRPMLTVPTTDARTCADQEVHHVAEHRVRLGRGMPLLALAVVDPGIAAPELFDQMEETGARVERLLAHRLDRA